MKHLRDVLLGVVTSLVCGISVGAASASRIITFDIAPQPLADALSDVAKQSGLQIVFLSELGKGVTTAQLTGQFTLDEAFDRLLLNTGLEYSYLKEDTVAIRLSKRTSGVPEKSVEDALRMAQAEDHSPESLDGAEKSSPPESSSQQLQEIVVTAQKREERLQDVPISISVLSGEDLDKSTAQGVNEILNRVPGVATSAWTQGGTNVTIRGVAAGVPVYSGASPVAYYLDTVPFGLVKNAIAPDLNPYDLKRVEVLRGPQGTLYGASAQNGVVRVLTEDANPEEFEFKARTSASGTKGGGENYRGDIAINVPIVKDKLAARAVIGYQDLGGWIDKPLESNANDSEISNLRLKLNAKPTDPLSLGLSLWRSRADFGAPSLGDSGHRTNNLIEEPGAADYDAYGLKIGYEFSSFSVTSTTSYLDYESRTVLDLLPQVGFSAPYHAIMPSEVISQELLLNSTRGERWRWSVGGMYRDAEDALIIGLPSVFTELFHIGEHSQSFAGFGELSLLALGGQVEFTGGLRYFEDDLTSEEISELTGLPPAGPYFRGNFDALSPRVVVNWHPNDESTVYVSYAEGFRSGNSQVPYITSLGFPAVQPDTLTNYELGAKGTLWRGRATFETALYFIDWRDVQQSLTVPFGGQSITANVNGETASGMGLDFGVATQPVDGFQFGVNFSWNDLTMDADVVSAGALLFSKGERLNFSPEYTVGASADYVFPLGGNSFRGRVSASANYVSAQDFRTIVGGTSYVARGDAMFIARTSFSIDASSNWTATLFADNLNNEEGSPIRQPYLGMPMPTRDVRIRPRTVGVQFEYRYR